MTRRTEQVASLIQRELGMLIQTIELPVMTTIAQVDVSADLKHAKVWITVFTEDIVVEDKVLDILKKNLYDLQGELNRMNSMHHTPRIVFKIDNSLHFADHINQLLRQTQGSDDSAGVTTASAPSSAGDTNES